MPLQNRVNPFGEVNAIPARGLFMGNRGGRIHTDDKKLTARRWASKQWICCALEFGNRQRDVWGRYYTELFFLDEITALSAGHRPCFECRRKNAEDFAARWQAALRLGGPPRAPEMDRVLHAERLAGREKRTHRAAINGLPNGTMIAIDSEAFAVHGDKFLRWSSDGYGIRKPRPCGVIVDVLTPPSTVAVLKAGYQPAWHPSAWRI